jgi:arginyl-tRNA synthetase
MNILAELRSRFFQALQPFTDDPAAFVGMIKPTGDSRFGDFQANCAMPLAKQHQLNPRDLATQIVEKLDFADLCTEPEIAGPGFINLTLRDDRLEEETNRLVTDDRLGVEIVETPRNYIIDFSSPNVAKPMHVGHLRSTVIGDSLCKVLRFLGHHVTSDNHIGDWGTQFGMIIFGYKHFLDDEAFQHNTVEELSRLYRLVNQLSDYHEAVATLPNLQQQQSKQQAAVDGAEAALEPKDKPGKKRVRKLRQDLEELKSKIRANEDKQKNVENDPALKQLAEEYPNIAVQSRSETAKLHTGDETNRKLWERILPDCLHVMQTVYDRLGISFDLTLGESYYQPMLAGVVEDLSAKAIAADSEGAVCVFVAGNEAPFIVRKTDGAFTYATTDLATIRYRIEELNSDELLYVVDARQSEHFKLLFETARMWGYDRTEYRHISFGMIMGEDKRPFKTRSGDTVGLNSLLDEAILRARRIVDENDDAREEPSLDEATRSEVAESVGLGGIKYADLHHNRESDYVFRWDKMLAKTGDTATYMQYSYARICGIFRRGNIDIETLRNSQSCIRLTQPKERSLALQLNRFAEEIEATALELRPNILTQYLFETANCFSTFYDACPVLKEEEQSIRDSRLLLCDLTARIIEKGLSLLGIRICRQM